MRIDKKKKEAHFTVVYWGPHFSGKTTTLAYVSNKVSGQEFRSDLKEELADDVEEGTAFWDSVPLPVGEAASLSLFFRLNSTCERPFVPLMRLQVALTGVDGIVLVVDSRAEKQERNQRSLAKLHRALEAVGSSFDTLPVVVMYNRQDEPTALPIEQLRTALNLTAHPAIRAIASEGVGVFDALKQIVGLVLERANPDPR